MELIVLLVMGLFLARLVSKALRREQRRFFRQIAPKRTNSYRRSNQHWTPRKRHPTETAGPNIVVDGITIVSILRGRCFVEDGDTIYIDGVSIRLTGVDAPELCDPYGNTAKFALMRLCKGQIITAELADHMSYGRYVATCYLPDGRDLSAEMVKMGLALDWRKFSGGKYRQFEPEGVRQKLPLVEAKHLWRPPAT